MIDQHASICLSCKFIFEYIHSSPITPIKWEKNKPNPDAMPDSKSQFPNAQLLSFP